MARSYTPAEIHMGLAAYAMASGSEKIVKAILKEAQLEIPIDTLRGWAYRHHKERYEQIKKEVEDHVRSQLSDQYTELAGVATEIQRQVLGELLQRVSGKELMTATTKDLTDILAKAGVAGGIALDKADKLQGRPTQIVRHDFSELRRALEGRGVKLTLPGEKPIETSFVDDDQEQETAQLQEGSPA